MGACRHPPKVAHPGAIAETKLDWPTRADGHVPESLSVLYGEQSPEPWHALQFLFA
jgi:hypothetical protein